MSPAARALAEAAYSLGILPEDPMSEELVEARLREMNLVDESEPEPLEASA